VQTLVEAVPELDETAARARAHAAFGLLNSTPHSAAGRDREQMRVLLRSMALAALTTAA
jgi:hypothetical protein